MQIRPFTGELSKIIILYLSGILFVMIYKNLGFIKTLCFFKDFFNKKNEISKIKFHYIFGQDKRIKRQVLESISSQAALYITLKKYLINEKALEYYDKIVKMGGVISLQSYLSKKADQKVSFEHLKLMISGMFEQNKKAKIHNYEIVISNRDIFQLNVTMCLLYEMLKELGITQSCISGCECDNIFFKEYLKNTGIQFYRKGTIAEGKSFCDFCFYNDTNMKQQSFKS